MKHPQALFLALAVIAPWAGAASDPALLGCWRSTSIVLHMQDGTKTEDRSGRCTLHFQEEQFESQCGSARSLASTYKYEIVRPNVYKATMTASTFSTQLLGSSREYEYRVEGERLVLVTLPSASTPVKVESESSRIACP